LVVLVITLGLVAFLWPRGTPQTTPRSRIEVARSKARTLAMHAQVWSLKNGGQPLPDLQLLAVPDANNGGLPYCKQEDLLDPWDQPFQIDPAGLRNQGQAPDIFTTVPGTGEQVGNFLK
jgi:hypothetical protein